MPDTEIIRLPLARLATIERQRAARGKAERVALADEMPLSVRSVPGDAAPVALANDGLGPYLAESWRAHGGRLYRPLWPVNGNGATPAAAAKEMLARAEHQVRNPAGGYHGHQGEKLQDMRFLGKAVQDRGIGPEGHHPVRKTLEDGREAQALAAATIADRLLLVDGFLFHAAPVPGWRVECTHTNWSDRDTGLSHQRMRFGAARWMPYADARSSDSLNRSDVDPWLAFGPEAATEAAATAEAVAAALAQGLPKGTRPLLARAPEPREMYRVVDRGALESAMPRPDPDAWLARVGSAVLARCARTLGGMPVAGVEAYLDARRALEDVPAAGGHERAFARLDRFLGLVREALGPGAAEPTHELVAALTIGIRYELFERRRPHWSPEPEPADMDALAGLAVR